MYEIYAMKFMFLHSYNSLPMIHTQKATLMSKPDVFHRLLFWCHHHLPWMSEHPNVFILLPSKLSRPTSFCSNYGTTRFVRRDANQKYEHRRSRSQHWNRNTGIQDQSRNWNRVLKLDSLGTGTRIGFQDWHSIRPEIWKVSEPKSE